MASHIVDLGSDDESEDEEVALDVGEGAVAGGVAEKSAVELRQEQVHEQQEGSDALSSIDLVERYGDKIGDAQMQSEKERVLAPASPTESATATESTHVSVPDVAIAANHADDYKAAVAPYEASDQARQSLPRHSAPTLSDRLDDTLPPVRSEKATLPLPRNALLPDSIERGEFNSAQADARAKGRNVQEISPQYSDLESMHD